MAVRAIGTTSTGSGKPPSTGTRLLPSAMQTNVSATDATIFSRVSAPPPPLIIAPLPSISSAPSTYTCRPSISFRSKTLMPCAFRRPVVATELDTAPR